MKDAADRSARQCAALESIGEIIGRSPWAPVASITDDVIRARYATTLAKLSKDQTGTDWLSLVVAWSRLSVPMQCKNPVTQFDDEPHGARLERPLWALSQSFADGTLRRWAHPQVAVGHLTGQQLHDIDQDRRVDFIFSPPWHKTHVWEVHGEFDKRDREKDWMIRGAGLTTINQIAGTTTSQQINQVLGNLARCNENCPWTLQDTELVDACWVSTQVEFAMHRALIEERWSPSSPVISIEVPGRYEEVARASATAFVDLTDSVMRIWEGDAQCPLITKAMSFVVNDKADWTINIDPHQSTYLEATDEVSGYVIRRYCVPWRISNSGYPWSARSLAGLVPAGPIDESNLLVILNRIFGYSAFNSGQAEAIKRILQREDTLLILPTGGGKSLVFQIAAVLLPGATLVVEGWRALLDDQVRNLQNAGVGRVCAIHLDRRMLPSVIDDLLIYVAPERLYIESFEPALKQIITERGIDLLVVDEAHAVSEAGHSFRPSYLDLVDRVRLLCNRFSGIAPPTLALTATASGPVMRDIQAILRINTSPIIPGSQGSPTTMARKNIRDEVLKQGDRPLDSLLESIVTRPEADGRGIIFCASKGKWYQSTQADRASWYGVDGVTEKLNDIGLGDEITRYVGGDSMPSDERDQSTSDFLEAKRRIMVATNAFGTGIDLPNVRWTCHLGVPAGMEAYYQEYGRAGRDHAPAWSFLVIDGDDTLYDELARAVKDTDAFARLRKALNRHSRSGGGLARQLSLMVGKEDISAEQLHPCSKDPLPFTPSFPGWELESDVIDTYVLDELAKGDQAHTISVYFGQHVDALVWKTIHRFKELGVIFPGYRRTFQQQGLNHFEVLRTNLAITAQASTLAMNIERILSGLLGKTDKRHALDEYLRSADLLDSPWERIAQASRVVLKATYQIVQSLRLQSMIELRAYAELSDQQERWGFIDGYFARDNTYATMLRLATEEASIDSWQEALRELTSFDNFPVGLLMRLCTDLPVASLPRYLLCFSRGAAESDSEMILYLRTWMLDGSLMLSLRAWAAGTLYQRLEKDGRQRLLNLIEEIWTGSSDDQRHLISGACLQGLPYSAGSHSVVCKLVAQWLSNSCGATNA